MSDHCGICGLPLKAAPLGGTYQCCGGGAYWSKARPLTRDAGCVGVYAQYGKPRWRLYSNPGLPREVTFFQPWLLERPDGGDEHA